MHTLTYINLVVHRVSRRTLVNQHHNRFGLQRLAEIILQMGSQIIVQVWVSKPVNGKQHNFQIITIV